MSGGGTLGSLSLKSGCQEDKRASLLPFSKQTTACHPELVWQMEQAQRSELCDPVPRWAGSQTGKINLNPLSNSLPRREERNAFPRPLWERVSVGQVRGQNNSFAEQTVKVISPFTSHFSRKRAAFTLAEVLITLGIIGIVAALTMPTLIQNHQKTVIETRLKKFYSVMNQAITLSEIQNGEKSSWKSSIDANPKCADLSNQEVKVCVTEFFNTYMEPYLKYTKQEYKENYGLIVYFSDGSCVRMKHPYDYYFYPVASKVKSLKTIRGKDFFPFQFFIRNISNTCQPELMKNKGIEPFIDERWDCTPEGLYDSPYSSTRLIQYNGWKIPKDYPWLKVKEPN